MATKEGEEKSGFFGRWRLKFLALIFAAVTWYIVHDAISNEFTINGVAINVLSDEGWSVLDLSTDTADIRLRGSEQDIGSLNRENIQVVLDVRGTEMEGELTVPISLDRINVPGGARPISIRPEEVTVILDREGERMVPVKVERQSDPPPGYVVEEVICIPAAVTLQGPLKLLNEVEEVKTLPIGLEGRMQSFSVRSALESPVQAQGSRIDPEKVTVEFTLVERSSSVSFDQLPIAAVFTPGRMQSLTVVPETVSVTLKGQEERLESLKAEALTVYVDCRNLNQAAEYELPIQVDVPARVIVESITPATCTVRVSGL